MMGHNEDGSVILITTGYMINATTEEGERYLAYCYPGELCGNAFGYNYVTKTVITCNALFPKLINTSAIGQLPLINTCLYVRTKIHKVYLRSPGPQFLP